MKKSILINLFIKKNNFKKLILNCIVLILIYTILFSFSLLLKVYENGQLDKYKYSSYSLTINGLPQRYKEDINRYFKDNYMSTTIIPGELYSKSGNKCPIDLEVTDDISKADNSKFSDQLIIKSKKVDESLNPIYIDRTIAKSLNVTLGDKVYENIGKSGKRVEFTVARIYEPLDVNSALVSWKGNQKSFYEESFGPLDFYSKVYIKSDNPEQTGNLISSKINKDLQVIYKSDELQDKVEELQFTPPTIIFTSVLGFIVFFIFICKESGKWISSNLRNIAILNYLGLSKRRITVFMFCNNVIKQLILFDISFLIVKFAVYDGLFKRLYLDNRLFTKFILMVSLFQIIATLLSCIYTGHKLKKMNITSILVKE